MSELLRLEAVSKHYPTFTSPVLHNFNLMIKTRETWVVRGPSGSGKTTLLQILGLMQQPTQGKVYFQGQDVSKQKEAILAGWRNRALGFVFQQFCLIPELTVAQNIELPARMAGFSQVASRTRQLLGYVGLAGRGTDYPRNLSGGEQQRVAIARALVNEPPLLLADEPTGNLDGESGREIVQLLLALVKQSKASFVLVTHNDQLATFVEGKELWLGSAINHGGDK